MATSVAWLIDDVIQLLVGRAISQKPSPFFPLSFNWLIVVVVALGGGASFGWMLMVLGVVVLGDYCVDLWCGGGVVVLFVLGVVGLGGDSGGYGGMILAARCGGGLGVGACMGGGGGFEWWCLRFWVVVLTVWERCIGDSAGSFGWWFCQWQWLRWWWWCWQFLD
ncbi:hypothetical protein U1Q18_017217 [Sarracenia purpurea var. burkii]